MIQFHQHNFNVSPLTAAIIIDYVKIIHISVSTITLLEILIVLHWLLDTYY